MEHHLFWKFAKISSALKKIGLLPHWSPLSSFFSYWSIFDCRVNGILYTEQLSKRSMRGWGRSLSSGIMSILSTTKHLLFRLHILKFGFALFSLIFLHSCPSRARISAVQLKVTSTLSLCLKLLIIAILLYITIVLQVSLSTLVDTLQLCFYQIARSRSGEFGFELEQRREQSTQRCIVRNVVDSTLCPGMQVGDFIILVNGNGPTIVC